MAEITQLPFVESKQCKKKLVSTLCLPVNFTTPRGEKCCARCAAAEPLAHPVTHPGSPGCSHTPRMLAPARIAAREQERHQTKPHQKPISPEHLCPPPHEYHAVIIVIQALFGTQTKHASRSSKLFSPHPWNVTSPGASFARPISTCRQLWISPLHFVHASGNSQP